ncbi:MAG: membrane protein insertase YidC, partial [Pirellulales bacterium]|nr:membrane protein insertase YidC [Pirellulales bacterium]
MDENTRNYLMAIVLSLAVLFIWQLYFAPPPPEQPQQQTQQTQTGQPVQAPGGAPAPPQPGTVPGSAPQAQAPSPVAVPAGPGARRDSVIKATPRIAIDTPRLEGSLSLKGARVDDLILKDYRVTVDPDSPHVTLFSPSGSRDAYYAEHGWVGDGTKKLSLPNADTVWSQQSSGNLKPGSPITLQWDNGEGLMFRRTISVDENYMFSVRQEVENKTGDAITLYPYALISRSGT